jgi:tRNA threonylcarbamoyladenosine biosynthesis protein TsaE
MQNIVFSLSDVPGIAAQLVEESSANIWLFHAEMGAGKTTIIKEVCKYLGVNETISSPTYAIVNEYLSNNGESIYHFDFYRLQEEEEALDIGVEEYLDSGNLCLLEWPDKIASYIPENAMHIHLKVVDESLREITVEHS